MLSDILELDGTFKVIFQNPQLFHSCSLTGEVSLPGEMEGISEARDAMLGATIRKLIRRAEGGEV